MQNGNNAESLAVHADLSYRIMSSAFEVHNQLGPGYAEKIYECALAQELTARAIPLERQKKVEVSYKGVMVGEYFLDMVVGGEVVLELKAAAEILPIHCAQALSYLKASGLRLAIVINFGATKVTQKRVVL